MGVTRLLGLVAGSALLVICPAAARAESSATRTLSEHADVWSYTDRWGDATGANLDGMHREDYAGGVPAVGDSITYDMFGAHRMVRNGEYTLPKDDARWPALSTDIVFVRLRRVAGGLDVSVTLNALGAPGSTIMTFGIDADGAPGADSTFPANAGVGCKACGIDRFVTVWGTGGVVTDAAGKKVGDVSGLAVDAKENVVRFTAPVGGARRVWGVSGVHDGAGKFRTVDSSMGGDSAHANVFDVAFDRGDRATVDERAQSDALAAGDVASDFITLGGKGMAAPSTGPVERVLVSSMNLGDGIETYGNQQQQPYPVNAYHYLGRLQPYLVYLPKGYDPRKRYPLVMLLHGYNGSYDEVYFEAPGMRSDVADKLGYVLVYPLGRGDVQYEGDSEKDLLEVLDDVEAHYSVDADRVHILGLSMGGFGTSKMSVRHPELFADSTPFLGVNGPEYLVNDESLPAFVFTATADLDPGGVQAEQYYMAIRDQAVEAHLKHYDLNTHEWLTLQLALPELTAFWGSHKRVRVPPRVTYKFDTGWSDPEIGLHDDHSYWLRDLKPAGTGTTASITADALTLPRADRAPDEKMSDGGDPADRSAYVRRDSMPKATAARPTSNGLALTLTTLGAGTVDLSQLGVARGKRFCVSTQSDGPATITLARGPWKKPAVEGVPADVTANGVVLRLPAGASKATIGSGAPCAG